MSVHQRYSRHLREEAPMENALAKRWMDFLAAEGFRPSLELNEDNTERFRLRFKAEGKKYSLYLDEEDPTFVHLELAYNLGDGRDLDQLARTANEVNESLKGAKTTVDADGGTARFHFEWFQEELPSLALLERCLSQLATAAAQLFERLGPAEPVKALA
jgi:hypothetical protein